MLCFLTTAETKWRHKFLLLLNVIFALSSKTWDLVITSNNSKPTSCKSGTCYLSAYEQKYQNAFGVGAFSYVFCIFVHLNLGFTPYIPLFVGMRETSIHDPSREIREISIYILFSHYKFNIINKQKSDNGKQSLPWSLLQLAEGPISCGQSPSERVWPRLEGLRKNWVLKNKVAEEEWGECWAAPFFLPLLSFIIFLYVFFSPQSLLESLFALPWIP